LLVSTLALLNAALAAPAVETSTVDAAMDSVSRSSLSVSLNSELGAARPDTAMQNCEDFYDLEAEDSFLDADSSDALLEAVVSIVAMGATVIAGTKLQEVYRRGWPCS